MNIADSQDPPEVNRKRKLKTEDHKMGEMKTAGVQDGCDEGGGVGGGMGAESQTAGRLGSSGITPGSRFHLIGGYAE